MATVQAIYYLIWFTTLWKWKNNLHFVLHKSKALTQHALMEDTGRTSRTRSLIQQSCIITEHMTTYTSRWAYKTLCFLTWDCEIRAFSLYKQNPEPWPRCHGNWQNPWRVVATWETCWLGDQPVTCSHTWQLETPALVISTGKDKEK